MQSEAQSRNLQNECVVCDIIRGGLKTKFEEDWEDLFDVRIGPFGMGAYFGPRPFKVRYTRTADTHLLSFQINREVKKEDIKVRLIEPGVLEMEWPRKTKGEEIPVE